MGLKPFIIFYCVASETTSETSSIPDEDPWCQHADFVPTVKPKRFAHKCGVCSERIWNVFNLVKCLRCKTIAHKSCVRGPAEEFIEMNSMRAAKEFDFAAISDVPPSVTSRAAWAYGNKFLFCESYL